MNKKKDFDILGVVLGVVVGIVIGFFIGNYLKVGEVVPVDAPVDTEVGYVYLLQIAKFDNPDGAINYQTAASNKGLDTVIVTEQGYYYLYGGIASREEKLNDIKISFEAKGYSPIIKKEYILDKANAVIDDNYSFQFWQEGINNLLNSLNDEAILISEKYYIEPVNLEFFSAITILQTIQNESLKNKMRLQTYKLIIEAIK